MARVITQRVIFVVKEDLASVRDQIKADPDTAFITLTDVQDGEVLIYKTHVVAIHER